MKIKYKGRGKIILALFVALLTLAVLTPQAFVACSHISGWAGAPAAKYAISGGTSVYLQPLHKITS